MLIVNLIDWRGKRQRQKRQQLIFLMISYLFLSGILLIITLFVLRKEQQFLHSTFNQLNTHYQALNQHITLLNQQQKQLDILKEQQFLIDQRQLRRQQLLTSLQQIETLLPKEVWLKRLSINHQQWLFEGYSIYYPAITVLSEQISLLPHIKQSQLKSITKYFNNNHYFTFTLLAHKID